MSFSDLSKKKVEPHVDTPAQAEARAQAAARVKAKGEAEAARAATRRESKKAKQDAARPGDPAAVAKGGPTRT